MSALPANESPESTGRRHAVPGRRARTALAVAAIFGTGVGVGQYFGDTADADSSLTGSPEFATLEQTWGLIHDEWALPNEVDNAALLYGAAGGMIDALGDDGHSRFLDPDDAKQFAEATSGEYTGIGVEIDFRRERPVIVAPIDGSPAAAAGVRSGDTILTIDGTETDRLDPEDVADLLLGDEGTEVTVSLLGRGGSASRELTLTRRKIELVPVSWRMMPGKIAHVRIAEFSVGATEELEKALAAARQAAAVGIVLDLRDNPGGLVSEAIGVASEFMDEGATLFQQQGRDGKPLPVETIGRDGLWLDKPLVVLVNGGSASAAEIVGGSLRDNRRATLLGETTFGTGTVLTPFAQPDGSTVLLGTALWLSADGERLWKEGVEPDREVAMPLDAIPSRPADDLDLSASEWAAVDDPQLKAAVEALGDGDVLGTGEIDPRSPS